MEQLLLPKEIRDWALIPIVVIVLISVLLRTFLSTAFQEKPKVDLRAVVSKQILLRAARLRVVGSALLGPTEFEVRRQALLAEPQKQRAASSSDDAEDDDQRPICLSNPPPTVNPLQALASSGSDPTAVVGMLKGQLVFLLLNGGLGYLISFLFSGFVVAKVPFPLPHAFRGMLQRGIDVPRLDVSHVSSMSWYFIVLFGLSSLATLIDHLVMGDYSDDASQMSAEQMMGAMGGAGNPFGGAVDMSRDFEREKKELEDAAYQGHILFAETDLLRAQKKLAPA